MKLNDANLSQLPQTMCKPTYDRTTLTAGIVHIGLGNFHRAHQSWYLHSLMQQGEALDWAIIGAGVRPYDEQMRSKLLAQDCMTTLVELDPSGISAEIVGSMIDYLPIEEGNTALIKKMAEPEIRIVSLTVTEGGYYFDPVSKEFLKDHPDIVYDASHPQAPRTAFGAMIAALKFRRDHGLGPFTAQSCDNLQGNGAILRQTLVSLARLSDGELADWIDQNCSFPNSMVDCIVPATGEKELALVKTLGVDDLAPVTHENFRQWVIEDNFCAGRPNWDKVGATFTNDVHAYETMKIRILNAGHQVIANVGELLSVETISGCVEHPLISAFFQKVEKEEIAPYVEDVPGMSAGAYVDLITQRFSNSRIRDTTRRVAFDGSSRHTGFLLPILRDAVRANGSISGLALVEAIWARMCAGVREDGTVIEPNDPQWSQLVETALAAKVRPSTWLEMGAIYGDLAETVEFSTSFENWLKLIWSEGCEAALRRYIQS